MSVTAGTLEALTRYGVKLADVATPLKEHQRRVVERLQQEDQPGLVAAHGLGSGKTLTSIAAAEALGLPADVVLPAALRANYLKELEKHVPEGAPETHIQSLENVARKQTPLRNPFLIVDEAHRGRNPSRTQHALRNTQAVKRLLLTGSPFYNQPSDIAAPVNIAAGASVLPADPDEFKRLYVTEHEVPPSLISKMLGGTPHMEYGVNPEQKKYLQDVLGKYVDYHPGSTENFPTREDKTIGVPMSSRQKEIYDTLIGKAPEWVRERVRTGLPPKKSELAQLNRFLQGTRQVSLSTAPYHLDRPAEHPKIHKAVSELNELLSQNPRAKALVYSAYLDAGINPYKAELDKLQIPYGEFTGAMPKAKRDQMVRDYNANKLRALLLSRAGGEGLDLKGTRLIQLLEPHWNEEALKQVIGRGIRYKSHEALPEDERRVQVQRFITQNPRRGIAERLHLKDPERSVDQYLLGLAQQKEELNQKFRDLLEAPAMSKTSTYTDGQKLALSQYGVQPPLDQGDDGFYAKKKKKSWLPALAAAGLGGLAAYKHLRTPTTVANKTLRPMQQHALEHGFHRAVDVSPRDTTGMSWLQKMHYATLPQVNPQGELDALNRFKLWAHEGSEAIPVAVHPQTGHAYVPGRPQGIDVKGVVSDRTLEQMKNTSPLIRGGIDVEGPEQVQRAVTSMGDQGKAFEANLLQQYLPHATPKTHTDMASIVGGLPNTGGSRADVARRMQQAVAQQAKRMGMGDYALKPTFGLDSRGQFPKAKHDWGKLVKKFDQHVANPKHAPEWQRLLTEGDANNITDYLHEHNLYPGYTIHQMMENPSNVLLQDWMPGAQGEWRVHTIGGAAPSELTMPRKPAGYAHDALLGSFQGSSHDRKQIRKFVEKEVLGKLPEEYRRGAYGMDVMPFRMPDGSVQFKVIEMNPHELAYSKSGGGGSGLLDNEFLPGAGWRHYRAVTGRHTEPAALAGALGTGAITGGIARQLTPEEDDDTPHPVG